MTNDTQNALTDFNLCLALSQRAINSQMETAWKAWKRRKQFQDTIEIFKIKKEGGQIVDSKYGLKAQIAPLTIGLNVESGKLGQVKVTLTLQSGRVIYYDESNEEKAEVPIENWSVSFITDLDKKPVELDALAIIDPEAQRTTKEVIEKSGLPDSVFSIEYLFLKFTKVDLLLSDNKNINIPDSVSGAARTKALSCLNLLLQGELGDFMLGTVVRRNNKQATPTFALTDFIFHVHSDWSVPDASTLSYLGMLANQPMPTDKDAARISLKDAWVRPEMIDGTAGLVAGIMAISKEMFMDNYLIPEIQKVLDKASLDRSELTWTFKYEQAPEKWQEKGVSLHTFVMDWKYAKAASYCLTLTVEPGTSKIRLSGKIESYSNYDGYEPYNAIGGIILGNVGNAAIGSITGETRLVSLVHIKGHQDISGDLNLVGKGISQDFNLATELNYKFHDIALDENKVEGYAAANDFRETIFKKIGLQDKTYKEQLEEQQKLLADKIRKVLDENLRRLNVEFKNHAFIPPGGGVFTFENPRFSQAGDLIFNVKYQEP